CGGGRDRGVPRAPDLAGELPSIRRASRGFGRPASLRVAALVQTRTAGSELGWYGGGGIRDGRTLRPDLDSLRLPRRSLRQRENAVHPPAGVEPRMSRVAALESRPAARPSTVSPLDAHLSLEIRSDLAWPSDDADAIDALVEARPRVGVFLTRAWLSGLFA